MIDRFTRQRFEAALPVHKDTRRPLWTMDGLVSGEYVYEIAVNGHARILVRSSVGEDGLARESGEDSIRLWVEVMAETGVWKAVAKVDAYTTRVNGWERRMTAKIRELWNKVKDVKRDVPLCPMCGKLQIVWSVGKVASPNYERLATKCLACYVGRVTFLDNKEKPTTMQDQSDTPKSSSQEPESPSALERLRAAREQGGGLGLLTKHKEKSVEEQAAEIVESVLKKRPPTKLNAEQLEAVQADLNDTVRVLAPPGSGKTQTIIHRYKWLVEHGVKPDEILAVTFSANMARELIGRITALVPQVVGTQGESQICSIHAACNRIAKAEGFARNIPQKEWEIKNIVREVSVAYWPITEEGDMRARPTWHEILSVDGTVKYMGLEWGDFGAFLTEQFGDYHGPKLYDALMEINQRLRANNWWMFADMVYDVEMRMRHDRAMRQRWQDRFQYVIIEEAQDTNWQAMRILTMLAEPHNRLFIVGDADQVLFRFTGATPDANLYGGFTDRYPVNHTVKLAINYRSTHNIVNRAKRMIRHNYDDFEGIYPAALRKQTRAREDAEVGNEIHFAMHADPIEEAEAISQLLQNLLAEGRQPGDIFVISRTRGQLGTLEGPLTAAGVPFVNITGGSFWQMRHVRNLLAYIRLAFHPEDHDALRLIYNVASNQMRDRDGDYCPTRWLGAAWLDLMGSGWNAQQAQATVNNRRSYQNGVNDLTRLMTKVSQYALQGGGTVADVAKMVIEECLERYIKHEEGSDGENDIGKMDDMWTVMNLGKKYKTFEDFFAMVDRSIKAAEDAKNKNWGEYIVLSTAHRIKGMERPVVVSPGWCEGEYETPDGGIRKIGLIPHTYALTEPPASGVLGLRNRNTIEDERCIAYVIVTRAQEEVYLTGTYSLGYGGDLGPSRFVAELGLRPRKAICPNCGSDYASGGCMECGWVIEEREAI